ncbi:MAG: TIGR02757 family protein [Bacteroidetes bacterium]|nr:TIGR02757 family protein [Bacteroidota bacterium]
MNKKMLKQLLDEKYFQFNDSSFIAPDPVSVPHCFTQKQDIEIAGLFAALLAWGNRTTIINSAKRLMKLMDDSPHDFILNHGEWDRQRFVKWVHRTFQFSDLLYFLEFLQYHYKSNESLESAFSAGMSTKDKTIENGLIHFHNYFFSLPHLPRTKKHLQTPLRKSACKRINLFLRWMVRSDENGVDFGLWKQISPSQLICPLDVHVHRTATQLKLITRKQADWQTAIELTDSLRKFDHTDPVKYDFALFGLGMEQGGKKLIK